MNFDWRRKGDCMLLWDHGKFFCRWLKQRDFYHAGPIGFCLVEVTVLLPLGRSPNDGEQAPSE